MLTPYKALYGFAEVHVSFNLVEQLIEISFSSPYVTCISIMIKSDMLLYFNRHDSLSDLSSAKVQELEVVPICTCTSHSELTCS